VTEVKESKVHLRGKVYFAVPTSIQGRQHLIEFDFTGVMELADIYAYAVNRGYLPVLGPQPELGTVFDARPKQPRRGEVEEVEFDEDGAPICPKHKEGMRESTKTPGVFYCPKKDGSGYCENQWSEKRGWHTRASGKGAARR
jgi:hypothetical protein